MAFQKKNIVITGGLGGNGSATVAKLLKAGVQNLAIVDIVDESEAIAKLPSRNILYKKCQVENYAKLMEALEDIKFKFGAIDILINAATIAHDDDPNLIIAINFTGVVNATLIGIELMKKTGGGRGGTILNISSMAGLMALGLSPIYSGTKHATVGFTRSLSSKIYEPYGIHFITICAGFTTTPLHAGIVRNSTFKPCLPPGDHVIGAKQPQSSAVIADCVFEALKDNENGAVWQCFQGVTKKLELQFPVM